PGRLGRLAARLMAAEADARPSLDEVERELRALGGELGNECVTPPREHAAARVRLTPPPRARRIEPIEPARRQAAEARPVTRRWPVGIVAALAVVLPAAFVLVLLPRWLPDRDAARPEPAAPRPLARPAEPTERQGRETVERLRARQQAERERQTVRELSDALDAKAVGRWGGVALADAARRIDTADARLRDGDYLDAATGYREATARLRELDARSTDVLRRALEDGERALAAGDAAGATAAFDLALAIAPEDGTAGQGSRRAGVLDRLTELLDEGYDAERAGELEVAERRYREALELDSLSRPAGEALARIESRLRDDRFAGFMSDGLAALERGDYERAGQAFERARAVRPDASEVADGITRLESARKLDAIDAHRARAERHETGEAWDEARAEFDRVLELDPTIVFAQQGAVRTRARAEQAARIEFHLAHPDRLSDDDVLSDARLLLSEAVEVTPAGPRHRQRVERLRELIERAATPVRVRLRSDNLTEVVVYHVGPRGSFDERELELRPGRYTVVGSRRGYRDVRHELIVPAGREPDPLWVRCEEPI
ncbi:MAG TPA: tetratricopeptide repeat protein, partial [Candidatus Polarisedimenticolaceae bacterium]|nr:tetratricopeptide repeat protein [Candidatus Polarisedimenticolaceae bacterium]